MTSYSLTHLASPVLLRNLAVIVTQDRTTTATMLAHIAEVDVRELYLPASCPSMYLYCVYELRMSEETAYRRIRVGRTARRFPAIFSALAEGPAEPDLGAPARTILDAGDSGRAAGGGHAQDEV